MLHFDLYLVSNLYLKLRYTYSIFRGSTAVGNGYYSGATGSNTYNGRNNATSAAAVNGYNRRVHAT